jgi:hypothetical protein
MLPHQRRFVLVAFGPLLAMTGPLDGCRRGDAGTARSELSARRPGGLGTPPSAVEHPPTVAAAPRNDEIDTSTAAWATWPMPNARLRGLPHPHQYDLATAEVVRDRVTGLEWQRRLPNQFFTYQEAGRHCAELRLAGHSDWRLPSRIELVSLLDTTRIQPSIDTQSFPDTPNDWFWTSSPAAGEPNAAWYVYFYFGYPKTDDKSSKFSVRCVRSSARGTNGPPRYRVSADEVTDLGTGLHWQRASAASMVQWNGAHAVCAGLSTAGRRGWRVPTLGELLTLIDERASSAPMIDRTAFPQTPGEPFWTSSRFVNGPDRAWYVRFDQGTGLYGRIIEPFRVRCVRD